MKMNIKAAAIALGLVGILGAATAASADVRHGHVAPRRAIHRVVRHVARHVVPVRHTRHVIHRR